MFGIKPIHISQILTFYFLQGISEKGGDADFEFIKLLKGQE